MRSFWAVVIASMTLAACAHNLSAGRTNGSARAAVQHTVTLPGETLAKIADWYTGSPNHWPAIAAANRGLDPHILRLGDRIYIPETLVFRRQPLPSSWIVTPKKTLVVTKKNSAANTAHVQNTANREDLKPLAELPFGADAAESQVAEKSPQASTAISEAESRSRAAVAAAEKAVAEAERAVAAAQATTSATNAEAAALLAAARTADNVGLDNREESNQNAASEGQATLPNALVEGAESKPPSVPDTAGTVENAGMASADHSTAVSP